MYPENRSPVELLDQLYTIAFWLTNSIKVSNTLVYNTYEQVDSDTTEIELFRLFRNNCHDHFGLNGLISHEDMLPDPVLTFNTIKEQKLLDSRISALLSEICGLDHQSIALIIDKPVTSIHLLIIKGRKQLLDICNGKPPSQAKPDSSKNSMNY